MHPERSDRRTLRALLLVALALAAPASAAALAGERTPRVLVVTAHPDDEAAFAGTVHRIVHALGGVVDLAVITDGAGGFRYAALAAPIYGIDFSNERVAREQLPRIRQREVIAAGQILGIRGFHFLDQPDFAFTQDGRAVLEQEWDPAAVRERLRSLLRAERYDFVLVPLPTATTHGAHQAAAIAALEVAAALPPAERPVILGGTDSSRLVPPPAFTGHPGFPLTAVPAERPVLIFDRAVPFDREAGLDHRIVAGWVIAEHKTQGRAQQGSLSDLELFYEFAINDSSAAARAEALFARLASGDGSNRDDDANLPRWYGVCPIDP